MQLWRKKWAIIAAIACNPAASVCCNEKNVVNLHRFFKIPCDGKLRSETLNF